MTCLVNSQMFMASDLQVLESTLLLQNGREFLKHSSLAVDVLSCGFNHYVAALGEQFSQVANSIEFLEQHVCPSLYVCTAHEHEKMEIEEHLLC